MTKATAFAALGAGLAMVVMVALGAFESHELEALDRLFRLRGATGLLAPITIVEIDQDTVVALNRTWPFPRQLHGEVLERLSEAGAVAIGLDLLFSEPSLHGEADDDALAESARRVPGLVMATASTTVSEGSSSRTEVPPLLPALGRTGAAVGYVDLVLDEDHAVRQAPLAAVAERLPFAVELHRVAAANGLVGAALPRDPQIWINFVGAPGTFPRLSYQRIVQRQFAPDDVRGRIMLVGTTDAIVHDSYATPFGRRTAMAGVEVQANVLHTLLTGRRIRAGMPLWIQALIAGACAALAAVLVGPTSLRGPLVVALGWVAVIAAAWFVFAKANLWLPVVAPNASLLLGAVVRILFRR